MPRAKWTKRQIQRTWLLRSLALTHTCILLRLSQSGVMPFMDVWVIEKLVEILRVRVACLCLLRAYLQTLAVRQFFLLPGGVE